MEVSEYVDIIAICRVCLSQKGTVNIFSENEDEEALLGYSIADRIMSFACVQVQANDGLPSSICTKCLTAIDEAFQLKAQCEYADVSLRQLCSENCMVDDTVCFLSEEQNGQNVQLIASTVAEDDSNQHIITTDDASDRDRLLDDYGVSLDEGSESSNMISDKENKYKLSNVKAKLLNKVTQRPLQSAKTSGHAAVCVECGEQFPSGKKLESHALSHPGHRPFVCDICGKRFIRLSNLKEHEKRHFEVKGFLCSDCGQFAPGKKNHYCTAVNDKSDKSYTCDICKKKFVSQTTLYTHKKRHGTQSKFQCSECKKLYFSKQELERHERVHLNIRPFECPEEDCPLTFFSQGELNRHMRYHKGIKRFACGLCGQKFFESGHLATHERKHTGDRPYRCRHCPKTFTDSSKLRRHSLCHSAPSRSRGTVVNSSERHAEIETANCDNQHVAIEENIKVIEVKLDNSFYN